MKDKIIKHLQEPVKLVEDTDYATYALKLDDNRVVEFVCTDNWLTINHAKLKDNEYIMLPSKNLDFWLYNLVKDVDSNCKNINLVVPEFDIFSPTMYSICRENLGAKTREEGLNSMYWAGVPININIILPLKSKYMLNPRKSVMFCYYNENGFIKKENFKILDKEYPLNFYDIGKEASVVGICDEKVFLDEIKKEDSKENYFEIGGFTWNNVTVSVDKTKYYHDGVIYEYGDKKDKGRPLSEILEEKMFN